MIVFDCSHILPHNTIPAGVEKIFISLVNNQVHEISNLPISLKQIIIKDLYTGGYFNEDEKKIKYGMTIGNIKIPFNCIVTDMHNEDITYFFE